jgi:hypothetical protein
MSRWLPEFAQSPVSGRIGHPGSKAGARPNCAIALWLTVISASAAPACFLGGQSGDPGQLQPAAGGNPSATTGGSGPGGGPMLKTGGNGPGPIGIFPCEGQNWSGPEAQRHQGSCTSIDHGQWQCECDGATRSVASESCSEALLDGCNIDVGAPTYCAAAPAECWPANDEGTLWRCRCAETDELQEIEARSCGEALNARCGATCEDALGVCRQDLVDYHDVGFECGCRASSEGTELSDLKPAVVPPGARLSCSETLALTCRARCANAAGNCTYLYEIGAYGCSCSDGSSLSIVPDPSVALDPFNPATFAEDACYQVLARGCGEIV